MTPLAASAVEGTVTATTGAASTCVRHAVRRSRLITGGTARVSVDLGPKEGRWPS
jgi:hypothetical protein